MVIATRNLYNSETFGAADMNQDLNVLSQRFGLDARIGHFDSRPFIEEGVVSHLRICFGTTEGRGWYFTGCPSEPLLCCVSVHLLHQTSNFITALDILKRKVDV
jgi:hypothetical protein